MSKKRSSAPARLLAALALICGVLALYLVVSGSLGDSEGESGTEGARTTRENRGGGSGSGGQGEGRRKPPPRFYVVQNGDTLTSIARRVGVSVDRILEMNPGVDPQILRSGEKLKLR